MWAMAGDIKNKAVQHRRCFLRSVQPRLDPGLANTSGNDDHIRRTAVRKLAQSHASTV